MAKLRQADVELGKGSKVPEVCRQLGVSEQTYYRWWTKYGGMDPLMAKQIKELEKDNAPAQAPAGRAFEATFALLDPVSATLRQDQMEQPQVRNLQVV